MEQPLVTVLPLRASSLSPWVARLRQRVIRVWLSAKVLRLVVWQRLL
jgi:hypothetical protein